MKSKAMVVLAVTSSLLLLGAVTDYPCQVANVTSPTTAEVGSIQEVSFQVTYDDTVQTDIGLYLNDSVTRELIDTETISANDAGEQTITLQFILPSTVGNWQMLYEVSYYSPFRQFEAYCENGTGLITVSTQTNTAPVVETPLLSTPVSTTTTTVPTDQVSTPSPSLGPIVFSSIALGLVVISIGMWYMYKKKFKKGPKPVVPKPGKPRKKYVCSCTVTLEAPSEIPLCSCWDSPMEFSFPGEGSPKAFLDVNDLQKKKTYEFKAMCTPHCAGPARNISYTWSLRHQPEVNQPILDFLELDCEASYDATLPSGTEVHVTCGAIKKIKLVQSPCQINIIYVAGAAGDIGYAHVGMQIICGPNNVIYGYYAANNSLSGPGQVLINDDPGKNYENFYSDYRKTVYDIRHLNKWKRLSCHQCARLVHFWQYLAQDPGVYGLDNTCTTRLADALEAVGLIDIKNFKKSFWSPVVGTNDMATSYPSQFISVLFEGSDPDAIIGPVKKEK